MSRLLASALSLAEAGLGEKEGGKCHTDLGFPAKPVSAEDNALIGEESSPEFVKLKNEENSGEGR